MNQGGRGLSPQESVYENDHSAVAFAAGDSSVNQTPFSEVASGNGPQPDIRRQAYFVDVALRPPGEGLIVRSDSRSCPGQLPISTTGIPPSV
jgi:hypothetical protein